MPGPADAQPDVVATTLHGGKESLSKHIACYNTFPCQLTCICVFFVAGHACSTVTPFWILWDVAGKKTVIRRIRHWCVFPHPVVNDWCKIDRRGMTWTSALNDMFSNASNSGYRMGIIPFNQWFCIWVKGLKTEIIRINVLIQMIWVCDYRWFYSILQLVWCLFFWGGFGSKTTLPKTNMAPKNRLLEKEIRIGNPVFFSRVHVGFRWCFRNFLFFFDSWI